MQNECTKLNLTFIIQFSTEEVVLEIHQNFNPSVIFQLMFYVCKQSKQSNHLFYKPFIGQQHCNAVSVFLNRQSNIHF